MSAEKPSNKEALRAELNSLLTTTHGEVKEAAESIAKALDTLIQQDTAHNKKLFEAVLQQAMSLPRSQSFKLADKEVRNHLINILENAKDFINSGVHDLIAINEKIKQEKKRLKERIKAIEQNEHSSSERGRFRK